MPKTYYKGLDLLMPKAVEATKLPRTCVIPVVKDPETGYLNAGAYSAGILSTHPYRLIIGVKSYATAELFQRIDTFSVAIADNRQIDNIWAVTFHAPPGIDEIELANWHPGEATFIDSPGIAQCPINLECKKVKLIKLPHPWRTVVIAEVVGAVADAALLALPRGDALRRLPVHEGGMNIDDGMYGLSTMDGCLQAPVPPAPVQNAHADGKVRIGGAALYAPENQAFLASILFPRPSYVVSSQNEDGSIFYEAFSMGFIQSTEPAVHISVAKSSQTYANIRRGGQFVVSVPTIETLDNFENLKAGRGGGAGGYTPAEPNLYGIPSLEECPIAINCKAHVCEDTGCGDLALVLGVKVGSVIDTRLAGRLDQTVNPPRVTMECMNDLYSRFIYKVYDLDMTEKTVRYDKNSTVPIKGLPTWGSRYRGAWWGEEPSCINYWLIELCQMHILTKREFDKIRNELRFWGGGKGIAHLSEFYRPGELNERRERLTRLLKAMVWAHRDLWAWDRVHAITDTLPDPYQFHNHHAGPMYYEGWSADEYV